MDLLIQSHILNRANKEKKTVKFYAIQCLITCSQMFV